MGELKIGDDRPHRCQLGPRKVAERIQGLHPEEFHEAAFTSGAVEMHRGERCRRDVEFLQQFPGIIVEALRNQDFAGSDPCKLRPKGRCGAWHAVELARGDVGPCQGPVAAHDRNGGEEIVPTRVKQRILHQGSGRHHPDDLAGDHRLAAAPARVGRILGLLADRNPKSLPDQLLQVGLVRPDGNAAHRYVLGIGLAALGQRYVESLRRSHRIVEEHLVEVAHSIEEKRIPVLLLYLPVLDHHRAAGRFIQLRGSPFRRCAQAPSPAEVPIYRDSTEFAPLHLRAGTP